MLTEHIGVQAGMNKEKPGMQQQWHVREALSLMVHSCGTLQSTGCVMSVFAGLTDVPMQITSGPLECR